MSASSPNFRTWTSTFPSVARLRSGNKSERDEPEVALPQLPILADGAAHRSPDKAVLSAAGGRRWAEVG